MTPICAPCSRCARPIWSAGSSWHIGDIPWGRRQHIGRDPEWPTAIWERDAEVLAWAWVRLPDHLDLAVHPEHPELGAEVMDWFREVAVADDLVAHAMDTEPHLIAAFRAAGFREVDDPHFMYSYTHSLPALDQPVVPDGFRRAADARGRGRAAPGRRASQRVPPIPGHRRQLCQRAPVVAVPARS